MNEALLDPHARLLELQDAITRVDNALVCARLTWLRSTPTDVLDQVYRDGHEQLKAINLALRCEVSVVRMGVLL